MKRPLKIVHLLASSKWTGPAEGVVTLCRDLEKRGHRVRLFCARHGGRLLMDKAQARGVRPEEELWLSAKNPIKTGLDIHRLKQIVRQERPDILHVHLSEDHWIGAIAARWARTPVRIIRTVHHSRGLQPKPFRHWLFETATNGWITLCDRDQKELLHRYQVADRPVATIHGAVDTTRFHPDMDPRPIRAEFGIGPATPVVGIVARFQPHRGHETLLKAFVHLKKRLPTVRLLLVGRGEHQSVLEQLVRRQNLEHHVIFTGYRDRDLPFVYAAMDVKVFLASGSDASCRAVLEAMACGLPVVACPVGALPETIVHGVTGYLVPEGDGEQLVDRLFELLADRGKARKMGEAARERILEAFTEGHRASRTEAFYERCLPPSEGSRIEMNRDGFHHGLSR